MQNMKNLQDLLLRVKKMLDGEKKRREVACEFLDKVQEILLPVASDIWPCKISCERSTDAVQVQIDIYFRWGSHAGQNHFEIPGFYFGNMYWGENVIGVRGSHFWYAIRCIVEWIPELIELMNRKEISREMLIALLK